MFTISCTWIFQRVLVMDDKGCPYTIPWIQTATPWKMLVGKIYQFFVPWIPSWVFQKKNPRGQGLIHQSIQIFHLDTNNRNVKGFGWYMGVSFQYMDVGYNTNIWVFPKIEGKPPKWMVKIMENTLLIHGWFGGKPTIFWNIHIGDGVFSSWRSFGFFGRFTMFS